MPNEIAMRCWEVGTVKNRGGYYTGSTRRRTGKVVEVTVRIDTRQGDWMFGELREVCGKRLSVHSSWHKDRLDELTRNQV